MPARFDYSAKSQWLGAFAEDAEVSVVGEDPVARGAGEFAGDAELDEFLQRAIHRRKG